MENGYTGIQNSDVATLSLLGRGTGYGYGGLGEYAGATFQGDGSAVKEGIRGNRDLALLESVNKATADQFLSSQLRQHDSNISDRISRGQDFLASKISDQGVEFRFANITAQFAALERQMIANQQAVTAMLHAQDLKQVECCCELKAGQATIIANQEAARLAAAEAENISLRTQIMINNSNGNGRS